MKQSKAAQIRDLEFERANLARAHSLELATLRQNVQSEETTRLDAQKGLASYVRSVEMLNKWLRERPELAIALEPAMRELGLWDVTLGYDPSKDLALSVASPRRA